MASDNVDYTLLLSKSVDSLNASVHRLSGGSGGGTSGGMEGRIGKLEAHAENTGKRLDRMETRLDSIAVDLARLDERVKNLPTKELVVKAALGTIAAIPTLTTFVTLYQAKLQSLLGVAR